MAISFARYSDLLVENREIVIPHLYLASHRGWPVGVLCKCLMLVKLEWLGYRMVKKLWRYVKPFSSDTGALRTDGQTDGRIDLLYQCRAIKIERCCVNSLMGTGNYSATSHNMKLVHWPLMGGLLHLVQRWGDWAGYDPAQSLPRCTKCNSPPISGQCIPIIALLYIMVRWTAVLICPLKGSFVFNVRLLSLLEVCRALHLVNKD